MALIICSECGKQFSDKAPACPNCGCPVHARKEINNNSMLCILKGVNGQVELYGNRIVITRKGALAKMTHGFFKGEKEIFLDQISSIQLKKGGLAVNGYIQFSLAGGNESTKGIVDATKDENTVMFQMKYNKDAEYLKNKIYELRK